MERKRPAAVSSRPIRQAKALAEELDAEAWHTIAWREGTNTELNSRFAAVRLRPASRDYNRPEAHAQEWLLIEWHEGEVEPSKYWPSTLPADATITQLVDTAKLRWRNERDYQELKQELGLGHYEGRGWRGFPPPRQPLYRRLWLPDLSAGDDSPLNFNSRPGPPNTWRSRRLSTPRILRSDQSGTSRPRSRPSGDA